MDIRNKILIYLYSERIKSGLIIAFKLISRVDTLKGEERLGAEKLLISYLAALLAEIRIAENVEDSQNFRKAEKKVEEAEAKVYLSETSAVMRCLSEALTAITTSAQAAIETLEKENLL